MDFLCAKGARAQVNGRAQNLGLQGCQGPSGHNRWPPITLSKRHAMTSTISSGTAPETPQVSGFAVIPIHILQDPQLGDHEVRVLLALSSYTGRDGSCWPSLRALAERTGGSSKRQLARIFNGYTRNGERIPGLVAKGYVTIEQRPTRSNVYRLNFDRWSGRTTLSDQEVRRVLRQVKEGGDTGDTHSSVPGTDIGAREEVAQVSPLYKEQHQENKRPPQPPRERGGRMTREHRRQWEAAEHRTQELMQFQPGGCRVCGEAWDGSLVEEELYPSGELREYVSPLTTRPFEIKSWRGDIEPRPEYPGTQVCPEELQLWNELANEITSRAPRRSLVRYWFKPLTFVRFAHVDGRTVAELAAPDEAHASFMRDSEDTAWARGSFTVDGEEIHVRYGVVIHEWAETHNEVCHTRCHDRSDS